MSKEILNKFENHMNIMGYSEKTIETYMIYLNLFNNYIKKDLKKVDDNDIVDFLSHLKNKNKVGSSTLNLVLSALKHFYNEFLKINIGLNIKLPKKANRIPIVLTDREVKNLIKVIDNERNKLIVEFIFSTGVRVSECVNMKINSINFEECTGTVVSGKGNKDRIIILSKKWVNDYKKYLENRKIKSEYLFCNPQGKALSVDTIQKFLKDYGKKAGIEKNISPHTLRHSFATNLLENDVNIRYIQQLLGHSNLNTTQIYTKVNTSKLKTIKNPLDNIE